MLGIGNKDISSYATKRENFEASPMLGIVEQGRLLLCYLSRPIRFFFLELRSGSGVKD